MDSNTPHQPVFDPKNLAGLRILVIEDASSNQDVVKAFLEPEGCECICVDHAKYGLEILTAQTIDLILMDVRLPGINGIEAIHRIRNMPAPCKDIPIIAITGDMSAKANADCMAAGANIFLNKPVMIRDLIESIYFVRRFQYTLEIVPKTKDKNRAHG